MSSSRQPFSSQNPFAKTKDSRHYIEFFQKSFFVFTTYFIIIAAAVIFGKILIEGSPVLAQKGWSFFTQKPQTLAVLDVEKSQGIEMPAENFKHLSTSNKNALPFTEVKYFDKITHFVRFNLLDGSVIGQGYLRKLEQDTPSFHLLYSKRLKTAPVGFTLQKNKEIILRQKDYDLIAKQSPQLLKQGITTTKITLTNYEVTIAKGQYSISKPAHDALLSTPLIFQMRQGFPDDEPNKICQCIIPSTQTLTVNADIYFSAFDEEERGTLPLENEKDISHEETLYKLALKKGSYSVTPDVLSLLAKQGVNSQHDLELGSILISLKKPVSLILSQEDFEQLKSDNPLLKIASPSPVERKVPFVRFNISKDCEILMDTQDYEALNASTDRFKTTSEHTHSYSGGGILGPIIGTAILVIICMIVALFTGIATATFLNEYARKGFFTKTIRLAMLNLAGVPSIVFGLFGLGLFVMLAPCVTSSPHYDSKLTIPLLPLAKTPTLRIAEEEQIYIAKDSAPVSELVAQTKSLGMERYYDGWTYLSFQGWGSCMLAGGFTLAIMVLPVIITSCEESLRAVPMGFREASMALGASKWQAIRTAVLPYALPGILTASVLGITRVAGETAPIMFTAAVAERSDLPWQGLSHTGFGAFLEFLQQSVQALPYHIYTVAGRIPQSEYTEPMQYGSVLVFMLIVMLLSAISVAMRIYFRGKIKW